jgi:maltose O-acetyltransferase
MRSEKWKMLAGELYRADSPELAADSARTSGWMARYNASITASPEMRLLMLRELFASAGEGSVIRPPFPRSGTATRRP